MLEEISAWLNSKGVYNAIIQIDGVNYKLNRSQGVMPAKDSDLTFPLLEAPEDIQQVIRDNSSMEFHTET